MNDQERKKEVTEKLILARQFLLEAYPFYGNLLMYMKYGFAACETAFTDMKRIVFDPEFLLRLTKEETCFVLQHEILHCVLQHIPRGRGLNPKLYNIACDIVVNSNILQSMGLEEMKVDGLQVMHLAPNGKEGYLYTAEKVYEMLVASCEDEGSGLAQAEGSEGMLDRHEVWSGVKDAAEQQGEWNFRCEMAVQMKGAAGKGVPQGVRKLLKLDEKGRIDWREILREFVVLNRKEYDYTCYPANKNYIYLDLNYPQFNETDVENLDEIYFFVDTSGSIGGKELTAFMTELRGFAVQFENLNCRLSFFDTELTEPIIVDGEQAILDAKPYGGGGTDFFQIFEYIQQNCVENLPKCIVILTDGWAKYPDESAAMGIPVLWILSDMTHLPPFGSCVELQKTSDS